MLSKIRKRAVAPLLSTALLMVGLPPSYGATENIVSEYGISMPRRFDNVELRQVATQYFNTLPESPVLPEGEYIEMPVDGTDYLLFASAMTGIESDVGSWAGVIIDPSSQEIIQTIRVQITELNEESVAAKAWVDGRLIHNRNVTVTKPNERLVTVQRKKNSTVIDCLTAAGVSLVAATAIVGICAPLCAVTVGTGCIACAAGISAIGGAYIGRCFG